MKYLLLSLLFISCSQQKQLRKQYFKQEKAFTAWYLHNVSMQMRFEETRDSMYLYRQNIPAIVNAYNKQVLINQKLKKPFPDHGIVDKMNRVKQSLIQSIQK